MINKEKKRKWLELALLFKLDYLVRPFGFRSFMCNGYNRLFNPITKQSIIERASHVYFLFDNPLGDERLKVHIDNIVVDDVIEYLKNNPAKIKQIEESPFYRKTYEPYVLFVKKELTV
jgi:hypothetical protein